jgi:hypothetical protein
MFQPVDRANAVALHSCVPASVLEHVSESVSRFWDAFTVTCETHLEQASASLTVDVGTPQQEEVKSFYGLYSLMMMTHEAIQFWVLLCEEPRRLPELTSQLTIEERRQLQDCVFATFVTSEVGLRLSRLLIDKLLKQMSSSGPAGRASHDALCDRLHSLCPSLFHQEDVMRAKVWNGSIVP